MVSHLIREMNAFSSCVARAKQLHKYLSSVPTFKSDDYTLDKFENHFNFRMTVPKNANCIFEISCSVPTDTNAARVQKGEDLIIEVAPFDSKGNIIYGLCSFDMEYCTSDIDVEKAILGFVTMQLVESEDYVEFEESEENTKDQKQPALKKNKV